MLADQSHQISMTQYTKFTKNLAYNENYTTVNSSNLNRNHTMHNLPSHKSASRARNQDGSPSLAVNSSLPKPVLITNLNSSNIGNLIKNERIKSSALARSVTMRYNTNTKNQFDNNNFTNGLMQPANQTNHFHYSRNKSSIQPHHTSTTSTTSAQQQIINEAAAQSKKEYLSLLSNIHRSSSIKVNRDKSNLSNYFSTLVQNKERGFTNSSINLPNSNSFYNQNPNSASNGHINQLSHNSSTLKQSFLRKQHPFSLRNNNINNIFNSSNNSLNNNNNNENNSNAFSYNTNTNANALVNSSYKNKTSISLDNVYSGIDSIITTNENPNRYNLNRNSFDANKPNVAINQTLTPTNNRKIISAANSANYSNIHNANMMRNSAQTPSTANNNETETAMSRQQRKRFPRMDTNDEDQDDQIVTSSTINQNSQNKIREEYEANLNTNGEVIDIDQDIEQTGIRKIEIINKADSRLSVNLKLKQNRKSNDESQEQKISKFDIMDQLDVQKALPNGHIPNRGLKSKSVLHANSPSKTISQSSYNSNAQIQKINGNNLHLIPDKTMIDLQNRPQNTANNTSGVGRPVVRTFSALSHITRDVNDSYAYTNVKQYIEENDLMPPDKLVTIKKWVKEVNGNFETWEKKTIEKNIEDLFL